MDWLVGLVGLIYIILAPYTKVEESFNIQACHDILYHGVSLQEYDHFEYPGVVPRTFLGPFMLSFLSWPLIFFVNILGFSKFYSQYIVRFVLGLLVFAAWKRLRIQVASTFGTSVSLWFTVITASQFHFLYYMSRPLPNTFALIFALLSFKYWLEQHHQKFLATSAIAILIFRSELVLLLGPMLLYDLTKKRLDIIKFLRSAIPIGLACLSATIIVDSLMWRRLLWPEGDVFWFNTYQNQSSNWGVYPFLWYWYSCLPRAMGLSLFLVPVGSMIDLRAQSLVFPGLVFVALYSFLPHKELRFIIYVFPLFNVAAARACHFFWIGRTKSTTRQLLAIAVALHVGVNVLFSAFLVAISSRNYPGGFVLHNLHQLVPHTEDVNVHIDNFSAQTGVTRFTQLNWAWSYNKSENLKAGGEDINLFTHLIVEAKSKYAYNLKHYISTHRIIGFVEAFSHLHFNYQSFPPVKIRVKPAIYILEKLNETLMEDDLSGYMEDDEVENIESNYDDEMVDKNKIDLDIIDDILDKKLATEDEKKDIKENGRSKSKNNEDKVVKKEGTNSPKKVEKHLKDKDRKEQTKDGIPEKSEGSKKKDKKKHKNKKRDTTSEVIEEGNGIDLQLREPGIRVEEGEKGILTNALDFSLRILESLWQRVKKFTMLLVTFYAGVRLFVVSF